MFHNTIIQKETRKYGHCSTEFYLYDYFCEECCTEFQNVSTLTPIFPYKGIEKKQFARLAFARK